MKSLYVARLTIRELDVFSCVVRGKVYRDQIARELNLSKVSVGTYVSRLRSKGVLEGRADRDGLELTEAGAYLVEEIHKMFPLRGETI